MDNNGGKARQFNGKKKNVVERDLCKRVQQITHIYNWITAGQFSCSCGVLSHQVVRPATIEAYFRCAYQLPIDCLSSLLPIFE
jgi:hypothetical protein